MERLRQGRSGLTHLLQPHWGSFCISCWTSGLIVLHVSVSGSDSPCLCLCSWLCFWMYFLFRTSLQGFLCSHIPHASPLLSACSSSQLRAFGLYPITLPISLILVFLFLSPSLPLAISGPLVTLFPYLCFMLPFLPFLPPAIDFFHN